jgi:hypothetical protein
MNKIIIFFLVIAVVFSTACAPSTGKGSARETTDAKAGKKEKVAEDLSLYRPTYAIPDAAPATRVPSNHVNEKVAILMDTVASVNKNIKYAQGYRILAYNGSERQTVMNIRKSIISRMPEIKDYLTYQQPNFRLKIGDFFNRVEAQQVLNRISDIVPNAQIVQDQININKTY